MSWLRRCWGPLGTLCAAVLLLCVARWIWAHHTVPAYNPDPTPREFGELLTLAIAAPAALAAVLAIVALYLRSRHGGSKVQPKADTGTHDDPAQ